MLTTALPSLSDDSKPTNPPILTPASIAKPKRQRQTAAQTQQAAKSVGGVARTAPELLQEVVNLTETTTAVVGTFVPDVKQ